MEPLAVEEMTALNRRREREDKIGKLMGEYLLKGYKMLGSTCSICGTILLKDRKQQDYCIGCNEVDNKIPDAPQTKQTISTPVNQQVNPHHMSPHLTYDIDHQIMKEAANETPHGAQSHPSDGCDPYSQKLCFESAISKLQERITWAASQLGSSNSVEIDVKLSELIYSCGKALKTLKELQQ